MKKLLLIGIAALLLSSCGMEHPMCPSYGFTKKLTKHGAKAQAKYSKHRRI
jgi:hypothetical protein